VLQRAFWGAARLLAAMAIGPLLASCGGSAGGDPATPPPTPTETGLSVFKGDEAYQDLVDGTGRDARFSQIGGLALDAAGNVYAPDPSRGVVRRVTPAGVVSTLPRPGAATAGCNSTPVDTVVAGDGRLYVVAQELCTYAEDGTWAVAVAGSDTPQAKYLARGPGNAVYVASTSRIWRYQPGTGITLLAGSDNLGGQTSVDGLGAAARFQSIGGITADLAGNAYASDAGNIRKVTPAGVVTTLVSQRPGVFGRVAVDASGYLTVSGGIAGLFRVSPTGELSVAPGSDSIPWLVSILGLVYRGDGQLYYASAGGVGMLSPTGTFAELAGRMLVGEHTPTDERPVGVDAQGNVVTLTPSVPYAMRKYDKAGQALPYGNGGKLTWPEMPTATAMDPAGNVYLAYARFTPATQSLPTGSPSASELYRVSPSGEVSVVFRRVQGEANFVSPVRMATDGRGVLYIGDANTNTVRRLAADGSSSVVIGPGDFRADRPDALAVDAAAKVYVGAAAGCTIVRLVADGTAEFVAGQSCGTFADGQGAAARFNSMRNGMVADTNGNLYVADHDIIRLVTPDGAVSTVVGQRGQSALRMGPLPGVVGTIRDNSLVARDRVLYFSAGAAAVMRAQLP
jgi:hypothetical protein